MPYTASQKEGFILFPLDIVKKKITICVGEQECSQLAAKGAM